MTDENKPTPDSQSPEADAPPSPSPPAIPGVRAPTSAGYEPLQGGLEVSNILNKLLKKPLSVVHHLAMSGDRKLPWRLTFIAIAALALFGVVVGSFSAGHQFWAAPVKIVGGVLFSGLICLPSLYIFGCLGGLDAKFQTILGLLCALLALTAILLVGFAPVVWLFSVSSESESFMGFLLLSLWVISVGFGLLFVRRASRALGMTNSGHLLVWCFIFLLVTVQMTTTLRPLLGESPKFLNLEEKRFFLQYWAEELQGENVRTPKVDSDDGDLF